MLVLIRRDHLISAHASLVVPLTNCMSFQYVHERCKRYACNIKSSIPEHA